MQSRGKQEYTKPEARAMALRYLGRREYAVQELARKLQHRGVEEVITENLIAELVELDVLSDHRFTEAYCRYRIARNFGPMKIRAELRGKGVPDSIIGEVLTRPDEEWQDMVLAWLERRLRSELDQKEKSRLYKAACNRGFSHDHAMRALDRLAANL